MLQIKRAYQPAATEDGARYLVDRIWPRGVKKEMAQLTRWAKEIAPSTEIRKYFNHEPEKFAEFTKLYQHELDENPALNDFIAEITAQLKHNNVTFVYAAKDETYNHAQVLLHYLNALGVR